MIATLMAVPSLPCAAPQDLFHTHFTVAALGLLPDTKLKPVHPVYCLPMDVLPEALRP